jgi:chorismate-pyruvate lyase
VSTQTRRTVTRRTSRPASGRISSNGLLYPLDRVCARAAVAIPHVNVISPDQIPQPYRSLLVHDSEMTRTLERHVGDRAVLRLLSAFSSGASYFRRILLVQKSSGRPIALGAIRVRLDAFTPQLRTKILAGRIPLGRILLEGRFAYTSTVKALLAVEPTPEIMGIFWMPESRVLYGRRSAMFRGKTKIADIVEVLPPLSRVRR